MQLVKACKELLIREQFYGLFLLNLDKQLTQDKSYCPTAMVTTNGLNFRLVVNEDFWNTLTDLNQLSILKHELMHLCFMHLTDEFKADNRENMNIAMD